VFFIYHYGEQEAFEKCWAHSPLRAAARRTAIHQVSLLSHAAATVARRLRVDVHNNDDDDDDNNDNALQRGPLWPHTMGPIKMFLLDQCSFAVKRPVIWNGLPTAISNMDLPLNSFRRELKTFCGDWGPTLGPRACTAASVDKNSRWLVCPAAKQCKQ